MKHRKRIIYVLCIAAALLWLEMPNGAVAETRVALVVGNSAYQNVTRLANPTGDAEAIASELESLGFDTTLVLDQDGAGLKQALRNFSARAKGAEIAAVYYAGHGMEAGGQNYLIPVDAGLKTEDDIDYELVPLDLVMRAVSGATRLRLIMLDACRNNPFAAQIEVIGGTRGVGRGFARVEPANNTLVAYAAKAGTTADDGDAAHSPFAAALLSNLAEPGQEVRLVFGKVRDDVLAATGNRQEPFVYGSLGGTPIYLAPGVGGEAAAAQGASTSNEAVFWQSIKESNKPALFQAYLQKYPNGDFVALAEAKLADLQPTETAALTPETAPPAAPEAALEIEEMDATYVAISSANMRSAPSTEAEVIARLKTDDIVAVTGKVKGKEWYRTKLRDKIGYVSAKLLQVADADEAAAWQKVKLAPSPEALERFLQAYPGGVFRPKAEALQAELTPPAPPPPAAATQDATATSAATPAPAQAGTPGNQVAAAVPPASPPPASTAGTVSQSPSPAPQQTEGIRVGQIYSLVATSSGGPSVRGTITIQSQNGPGEFIVEGDMAALGWSGFGPFRMHATLKEDGDEIEIGGGGENGAGGPVRYSLRKIGPGKYYGRAVVISATCNATMALQSP